MPKKRKGKVQGKCKILSSDPVGKYDKSNILPDDYQPKRGRARKRQLEGMTEEEKNAEKKARLLKTRRAVKVLKLFSAVDHFFHQESQICTTDKVLLKHDFL